jgi:hypothetical protein
MTTGKHIGKVLLQIRQEEDSKVVVPVPRLMNAYPQYFCNPSYSYIIAGTEYSYAFLPSSKNAHMLTLTLWSDCYEEFVKCKLTDLHLWDI